MRDVAIRRVAQRDLPHLLALMAEHVQYERAPFQPPAIRALEAMLFGEHARLLAWIADTADGAAGYVSAAREISTWAASEFLHVDCLFVREAARNLGLGRRLLQVAIDEARRLCIAHLEWQTPIWNEGAIRFYGRQGATGASKIRFRLMV